MQHTSTAHSGQATIGATMSYVQGRKTLPLLSNVSQFRLIANTSIRTFISYMFEGQ